MLLFTVTNEQQNGGEKSTTYDNKTLLPRNFMSTKFS